MSVNALSERLVARLVGDAARLSVDISRTAGGTVIADAGVWPRRAASRRPLLIARICIGGLGRVARHMSGDADPLWPT